MTRRQIKYTGYLLLLLYVGYYSCVSLFVHTHIYNGIVYIHSHPYPKEKAESDTKVPYQTHQHNGTGFFVLNQLSSLTSNEASLDSFLEPYKVLLIAISFDYNQDFESERVYHHFQLRAPPYNS